MRSSQLIATLSHANRHRSLTDGEVRAVARAISHEGRKTDRRWWTAGEDRRLKRMLESDVSQPVSGSTVRRIAAALGRSEGAVWSRIRVLRGHNGHRSGTNRQGPRAFGYGVE